jgi:hypothetical protein
VSPSLDAEGDASASVEGPRSELSGAAVSTVAGGVAGGATAVGSGGDGGGAPGSGVCASAFP